MTADGVVSTALGTFEVPDEHFAKVLRDHDGHQRSDVAVMCSLVAPGDLVLDVGAFIGTVAIPLARAVAPGGQVIAFEALPEHVRLLRANAARNGVADAVTVVPALVCSTAGPVTVHAYDQHSSATNWYQPAEPGAPAALNLPTTTLDTWYDEHGADRPVALIKVDVEGMEVDVLRGAERLIAQHRPALHVEVASFQLSRYGAELADLDRLLKRLGYRQFVNLAPQDGQVGALARIGSTRLFGPALGDVVAVHRSKSRAIRASRFGGYARFARLWLKRTRS